MILQVSLIAPIGAVHPDLIFDMQHNNPPHYTDIMGANNNHPNDGGDGDDGDSGDFLIAQHRSMQDLHEIMETQLQRAEDTPTSLTVSSKVSQLFAI